MKKQIRWFLSPLVCLVLAVILSPAASAHKLTDESTGARAEGSGTYNSPWIVDVGKIYRLEADSQENGFDCSLPNWYVQDKSRLDMVGENFSSFMQRFKALAPTESTADGKGTYLIQVKFWVNAGWPYVNGGYDGESKFYFIIRNPAPSSGTCGANLTWSVNPSGTLSISGTGAMTDYTGVDGGRAPWYDGWKDSILSVNIADGVTGVGSSAFADLGRLNSVTIPASVTNIGEDAFSGCGRLANVYYADTRAQWEKVAIADGNEPLLNATMNYPPIPVTGVEINRRDTLELTEGDTVKLTATVYPDDATNQSVTWSSSQEDVAKIGASTGELTALKIGKTTVTVTTADGGKTDTLEVTVAMRFPVSGTCGENLTWSLDADGTLTVRGSGAMTDYWFDDTAPWYAYRDMIKTAKIEYGVTSIGKYAFYQCSEMHSVDIPDSVADIGMRAFWYCGKLDGVEIPGKVTIIRDTVFSECKSLTSAILPEGVTEIGQGAFGNCKALTRVYIPNSVTEIGYVAFQGCNALPSVEIPDSVTTIGNSAFNGCGKLESVKLPKKVTSIGDNVFYNCESLTSVFLPEGVTRIGESAFEYCGALASVDIPASVTDIESCAFKSCNALTDVYYGGSAEQWGAVTIGSNNTPLKEAKLHPGAGPVTVDSWRADESGTQIELAGDTKGLASAAAAYAVEYDAAGRLLEIVPGAVKRDRIAFGRALSPGWVLFVTDRDFRPLTAKLPLV